MIISASLLSVFVQCPRKFEYTVYKISSSDKVLINKQTKLGMADLLNRNLVSLQTSDMMDLYRVSASSLSTFKKCRKQFEYNKKKTPLSDRVPLTPFQFGSLVHNTMDKFIADFKEKHTTLLNQPFEEEFKEFYYSDELKAKIKDKINSSNEWMNTKDKVFKDFYISLGNHFNFMKAIIGMGCEPQLNFWFGTAKSPLYVEDLGIPQLRLTGEIDHYFINVRGNLTIEDTKTSSSDYFLDRNQLYLYAVALEQVFKNNGNPLKVDELNYNLVKIGKKVPVPFGPAQREALTADLQTLNTCVELNTFQPFRGKHCESCGWRTLCRESTGEKDKSKVEFLEMLKSNHANG